MLDRTKTIQKCQIIGIATALAPFLYVFSKEKPVTLFRYGSWVFAISDQSTILGRVTAENPKVGGRYRISTCGIPSSKLKTIIEKAYSELKNGQKNTNKFKIFEPL